MARKERGNKKLRKMMDEYGIKTLDDVHTFVKMLTAETIPSAFGCRARKRAWLLEVLLQNKRTENLPAYRR